jgi:hypothetical protein
MPLSSVNNTRPVTSAASKLPDLQRRSAFHIDSLCLMSEHLDVMSEFEG